MAANTPRYDDDTAAPIPIFGNLTTPQQTTYPHGQRLRQEEANTGTLMLTAYRTHLLAAGRSTSTIRQRLLHLDQLGRHHPNLLTLTTADLETFIAARHTLSAEYRKSIRSTFRSFYTWTTATGRTPTNPAIELDAIRIPRKLPRVASDPDVLNAIRNAPLDEKAMVLLGRLAALRLTEIASLHTRHREGDLLRVTGKGNKQRMVPINAELMNVLVHLESERQGGYYFPGRFGGYMHPQSVNKIITRRLGMNPHSLRHAAATAAYRQTKDLRAVQEFLGHSSLATTERYLHMDMDALRAAAAATSLWAA